MGLQITTIENEEQYQVLKSYYDTLYSLFGQHKDATHILLLLNKIKVELTIWENR